MVISIEDPKNKRFMGRTQFSVVDDSVSIAWTEWYASNLELNSKMFPRTSSTASRLLNILVQRLHLSNLWLTCASLRAGGATFFFEKCFDVNWLRFRGRWRALATLERYVQEAMVFMISTRLTAPAIKALRERRELFDTAPSPPLHVDAAGFRSAKRP